MTERVYLSVGSNIDREVNSRSAVAALRNEFGALELSPMYESDAVGFNGAPFFNFIVGIQTSLALTEVIQKLKAIEDEHGRQRGGEKFSSRSLDIDVVTYGTLVGTHDGIELPRPELFYNAFVLLPMIDLLGAEREPKTGLPYSALRERLPQEQRISRIDFIF